MEWPHHFQRHAAAHEVAGQSEGRRGRRVRHVLGHGAYGMQQALVDHMAIHARRQGLDLRCPDSAVADQAGQENESGFHKGWIGLDGGKVTEIARPGAALAMVKLPPWASATSLHRCKPRPTPPSSRVRAASGR